MFKSSLSVLFVLVIAVVAGCSTMSPQKAVVNAAAQAESENAPGSPVSLSLPDLYLSEDLLYEILEAEISATSGRYLEASDLYFLLAQKTRDPRIADIAIQLAKYVRDDQRAIAAAELKADIVPDDIQNQYELVNFYVQSNNPQGALPYARAIAEAFPGNVGVVSSYAEIAYRAGELSLAITAVGQALAIEPSSVKMINLRARILLAQNDYESAQAYMQENIKKYPDEMELRASYGHLLTATNNIDEAMEQYKLVIKQQPDNGLLLYMMGIMSLNVKDIAGASGYFERAMALGYEVDSIHYNLGLIAAMDKDNETAIEHFLGVTETSDFYADARTRLAVLVSERGDVALALLYLDAVKATSKMQIKQLAMVQGDILMRAGRYADALVVYGDALDRLENDIDLLYVRSIANDQLGDMALVEQDLRAILDVDPNNINALNAFGYALSNNTSRYHEARGYIEQALALRPDDNAILDSMGWVLYRLGEYDQAVDYLQRSYQLVADMEVAAHLGEVLWVMGDHDEARIIWQAVLELMPDNTLILDLIRRFDTP